MRRTMGMCSFWNRSYCFEEVIRPPDPVLPSIMMHFCVQVRESKYCWHADTCWMSRSEGEKCWSSKKQTMCAQLTVATLLGYCELFFWTQTLFLFEGLSQSCYQIQSLMWIMHLDVWREVCFILQQSKTYLNPVQKLTMTVFPQI